VYQAALAYEFNQAGIRFEKEKHYQFLNEDKIFDLGFRFDFLDASKVIVACKAVQESTPIDQARLINKFQCCRIKRWYSKMCE